MVTVLLIKLVLINRVAAFVFLPQAVPLLQVPLLPLVLLVDIILLLMILPVLVPAHPDNSVHIITAAIVFPLLVPLQVVLPPLVVDQTVTRMVMV